MTQEVAHILESRGYSLSCRGTIRVKGKGDMITYFLDSGPATGVNRSYPVKNQLPPPAFEPGASSVVSNNNLNHETNPLIN